jgi:hypothetical protein
LFLEGRGICGEHREGPIYNAVVGVVGEYFSTRVALWAVAAEPLEGSSFELEGNELIAIEVGHTDTDNTTLLHVPAIGLVVAGDVAYNDVHLYLAESRALRARWRVAQQPGD